MYHIHTRCWGVTVRTNKGRSRKNIPKMTPVLRQMFPYVNSSVIPAAISYPSQVCRSMSSFSSCASFWVSFRPLKKAVSRGESPPAWR